MKTSIMQVQDIKPAPYNPRVELQPGDQQYEALSGSLSRFGLVEPLIVNERTGTLVGGHQRLNVLKAQGVTEAEVVLIDIDPQKEKLLNIALNKVEGLWDYAKLEDLFATMDMSDILSAGFTEAEIKAMYSDGDIEYVESKPSPPAPEPPGFIVYLSFPSQASADAWLAKHSIEADWRGGRAVTVEMGAK